KRVAASAVCLCAVARPRHLGIATPDVIDALWHGLKVVRIDAARVPTQMVDDVSPGNVPHEEDVRPSVCVALQVTPQPKGSVAATIGGCHPLPAAILKVLDLRQEARDRFPDWAPPLGLAGNRLLDNRLF